MAAASAPLPHCAGTATVRASHASGYVHPAIAVGAAAVSPVLNQPSPTSTLLVMLAVKVGGGKVTTVPVEVYDGRRLAGPGALEIVAGGHWPNDAVAVAAIVPAPAPPVCHDSYSPSKGELCESSDAHVPLAVRGSAGIHPFSRPSWYDQRGASTLLLVDEFPIFHVQKKKS